jgi:hypothetical protein
MIRLSQNVRCLFRLTDLPGRPGNHHALPRRPFSGGRRFPGLLDAIDILVAAHPQHLLHGHEPLTRNGASLLVDLGVKERQLVKTVECLATDGKYELAASLLESSGKRLSSPPVSYLALNALQ